MGCVFTCSLPSLAMLHPRQEMRYESGKEREIKREGLQRKNLPLKMKTPFTQKAERWRFTDGWGPRLEDGD